MPGRKGFFDRARGGCSLVAAGVMVLSGLKKRPHDRRGGPIDVSDGVLAATFSAISAALIPPAQLRCGFLGAPGPFHHPADYLNDG